MLAAEIAGADEVWRIGGAQAVAALAYGTQSMVPVDKITGPAMPMSPPPSGVYSVRSAST